MEYPEYPEVEIQSEDKVDETKRMSEQYVSRKASIVHRSAT